MAEGLILDVITPRRTIGNPFGTLALAWCPYCKDEVDTNNDVGQRGHRYVFRTHCQRCGQVIAWGAYEAPLIGDPSRMMEMREWCTEPTHRRD